MNEHDLYELEDFEADFFGIKGRIEEKLEKMIENNGTIPHLIKEMEAL
jgi:hypothetical protein